MVDINMSIFFSNLSVTTPPNSYKLVNTCSPEDILHQRLIQRESLWIQQLETLVPNGLNQYLSKLK